MDFRWHRLGGGLMNNVILLKKLTQKIDGMTVIKIWTGTLNEYEQIEEKDPNTLYLIKEVEGEEE